MKTKVLLIIFSAAIFACSNEPATIRENLVTFVTYPFSDPDAVPRPERNYYPYFRFDGFTDQSEEVDWKVVTLENKYIKVDIFPEIGGKIWGAIEKSTGNEFLYYNSVVKFRNIAMRGAWTAGGVELNFGIIGHTPAVSTPVDYMIRENDDGSVSCFVSAIDLLTRTRWETEVRLHPDNAYFTTNTRWNNSTPLLQPYYQWSNAAYQVEGDLEFIFPRSNTIGHGGEPSPWPIDENGRDLSWYKNHNFGGSFSEHAVGGVQDFYAAYWHDLDFGSGHYSMYGDKLGEKVFIWSSSRSGGIWEDLLTDSDGQYLELQSGRLFNQATAPSTRTPFKHFGFAPYTTDTFLEYWYPIMDIGGVVQANYLGALNVVKGANDQNLYLSPLQSIKDDIEVWFGDELKYSFSVDLKPLETWEMNISKNPESEPLKVVFGNNQEFIYLEGEDQAATSRPLESPEDFDWNSVYGLFTDGVNWVYQNRLDRAYLSFRACLEKDPLYAPALNHIAELYYRKSDFESALDNVIKSLSINTYDPQANFLLGLISRRMNSLVDAQDGFAVATLSPSYRTAANIELAKFFILKDELNKARQYAGRILESDVNNEEALVLSAVISRKNGNSNEAKEFISRLEGISPLNHFSRFEKLLLNEDRRSADSFTSMIRNELPHETYTEMALWYEYIGERNEAVRLLEMSPPAAMVYLKLSYLYNDSGDREKSDHYFNQAISHSPDFVFPFRTELVPMLEWAVSRTDDWKAKYYLGLLHWSLGSKDLAKELFYACGQAPDSPYFYLARTDLLRDEPGYSPENDILKAYNLGRDDYRTSMAMIDHYLAGNRTEEALRVAEESVGMFPDNYVVAFAYANCLMINGQYSASLEVLENTVILPTEGAWRGRTTYRQAALMEGLNYLNDNQFDLAIKSIEKARLWPENLGVGRPFQVDERIEDFLAANYFLSINEKGKAEELFNKVISFTQERHRRYNSTDFLYLAVLRQLNMNNQAERFLQQWQQTSPNDPVLKWTRAMLNNNRSAAQSIEREIATEAGGTPWDPRYGDIEFELVKAIALNMDLNF